MKTMFTKVTLCVVSMSWMGLSTNSLAAQELATNTAKAPPPKAITVAVAAMDEPPPNAEQYADEKQERIGEHHRPTIELVPMAGVQALAAPLVPQTTVVGGPVQAATDLELLLSHSLTDSETSDITSTVCEPSAAARGDEVLVTGNWFAAFSKDGGNSFTYVNPDRTFPSAAGGFCCDQVAIYDPKHDVMFWYLQYITNAQGNVGRLAVAQGDDIKNQNWRYYDFSPREVGDWGNEWFDYPDLALSNNYLYVTTNVFGTSTNRFTRAVILRLPLDKLAQYQGFDYRYFDTNQIASIRPTQGATEAMYFGAHRNLSVLRLLTWPENSDSLDSVDLQVQPWSDDDPAIAPGPDGNDWLGRSDGRVTGGGVASDRIAFAWTAAQDDTYDFPQARVVLIDKNNKTVVGEPHVWNEKFAFAYPTLAPNATGELGITLHYGGGSQLFPSHAVGAIETTSSAAAWNLISTASGTDGPSTNRWGDYLAIRPHGKNRSCWIATGFTLQGGTDRTDIEVKYVHFGREGCEDAKKPGGGDGELEKCRQELEQHRNQLRSIKQDLQKLLDRLEDSDEALNQAVKPQRRSKESAGKKKSMEKSKKQSRDKEKSTESDPAEEAPCC